MKPFKIHERRIASLLSYIQVDVGVRAGVWAGAVTVTTALQRAPVTFFIRSRCDTMRV